MSAEDIVEFSCGCRVNKDASVVDSFCHFHENSQPQRGDELFEFLYLNNKLPDTSQSGFIGLKFYNDTDAPMVIRSTSKSSRSNPGVINRQSLDRLQVRPGGFLKLWKFRDSYELLVE